MDPEKRRTTKMNTGIRGGIRANILLSVAAFLVILLPMLMAPSQTASALGASSTLSSNDGIDSALPQLAVSGSNVYVTWRDSSAGVDDIFFASSADNGVTFSDPVNISNSDGASSVPQLAVSGSNVYVTWQDGSPGNFDILLASSSDNFGNTTNISSNDGSSLNPQLAVSGSNVYVTWQDGSPGNDDIFFASSADNGVTFSDPVNISNSDGASSVPQLAVSGSNVYVTWQDGSPGNFDILLASSSDNFGNTTNISSNDGSSLNPQLAVSGSNVYVTWQDGSPGNDDIFFASSADNGVTFSDPVNISNSDGASAPPQIAVSGSNVYVTWSDDSPGNEDVFLASSADNGVTFSDPVNVSSNDGASFLPQTIISTSGNIHVAWTDNSADESNFEILLSASTDGSSFGCPVNLSSNPGNSIEPAMALADDGSSTNVVWHDLTTGVFEVQLQSGVDPSGPAIVTNPIGNTLPLWGTDEIQVSGSVANAANNDKVILDWGDGSSEDVAISGCSWDPVSHAYSSSAVGTNNVVARLAAADDTEKDVSAGIEVNVLKHPIALTLDPITSVKQGSDITGAGSILDAVTGDPISGANITFVGSGATGLSSVLADSNGLFSSTGSALNSTQDNLIVEAHFGGDPSYEPAVSGAVAYDIASSLATEFAVPSGSNVHVELTGFNASISFDEVFSGGVLFVSECTSPASVRFAAIDMCLRISPTIQMGAGYATVNMSFAGKDIPSGYSASDIDIFHETISSDGASTVVDVTSKRSLSSETVAGKVASLSNFIGGIALHDAKLPGAHRTQILVGDDNPVSLRDISNQQNSSATASARLNKESYKISEDPIVTVIDSNGNVEPGESDIVLVEVMSETSDPLPISVTLTEDSVASGIFVGSFGLTSGNSFPLGGPLQAETNDRLSISYIPGTRFQAEIDGVTESGLAELSDFNTGSGLCFDPVGSAISLKLIDSELGPNGKIGVKMSYVNAFLGDIDPSSLRVIHRGADLNWVDITLAEPDAHDPIAKTIAGEIFFQGQSFDGRFSLGTFVDLACGGGAGGGFGRGLIVDAVASIAKSTSGGGGGGGSRSAVSQSTSTDTTVQPGEAVNAALDIPAGSGTLGGELTLNFEHVVSAGSISVKEESLSASSTMFDSVGSSQASMTSTDGASFTTAGPIFNIDPSSDLQYQGTIQVTIPYDEGLATSALGGPSNDEQLDSEENVRFMHFNGAVWEDQTVSIDPVANTVTGEVSSFSVVVAAVVDDGTFPGSYFAENPASRLVAMSSLDDSSISFVDALGNSVSSVSEGSDVAIVTSYKNLQRTSQNYLYIMEVFDSQGIVVNMATFTGTMQAAQDVELDDGSFRAEGGAGEFTIKVFMLDEAERGSIFLAPVIESKITVVSAT